jgi:hypothetical protein
MDKGKRYHAHLASFEFESSSHIAHITRGRGRGYMSAVSGLGARGAGRAHADRSARA